MTSKGKKKRKAEKLRLRVMAEYGSSGIWVIEPVGPFRHAMISWHALGLPADLANGFEAWIDTYWQWLDDKLDLDKFNADGRRLAQQLKQFVGPDVYVEYDPQSEGDAPIEPEVIEQPVANPRLRTDH